MNIFTANIDNVVLSAWYDYHCECASWNVWFAKLEGQDVLHVSKLSHPGDSSNDSDKCDSIQRF